MNRSFSARLLTLSASACLAAVFSMGASAQIFHHAKKPKKATSSDPLAGVTSKQPDKELFEKAMIALKKGKYDVARLDLQALLTTYPESEYQMRAKLAVGDSWYKEGGAAALQQAEAEYKDFITFFPNQPEAAEAQMKVGDIYYQEMEKPDRDPTNAERAEQEYRLMIQQYPDSTLVPRAKQRLREVQEVLAQRQYTVGAFYATHDNWPASIARLQTVTDSYPLFSKSDLALLQLGDDYAAEAGIASHLNINAAMRERLIASYDDRAADCYAKVVTRYPMAPHVEDAREKLISLGRPVPEPTQTELAESEAEEQSRANIKLKDRAILLVKHGPSTLEAARVGEPLMTPAMTITAPEVSKENIAIFNAAAGKPATETPAAAPSAAVANGTAAPRTGDAAVPNPAGAPGGAGLGVEILNPNGNTVDNNSGNATTGANPPAAAPAAGEGANNGAPGSAPAAGGDNYGLKTVGPANTAPLPPVEKPAEAQQQVNDVKAGAAGSAQVQTGTPAPGKKHKKNPKVKTDHSAESSSTNKKKTGIDKLNPF
ncbi:MAG TPA: outer membrane protein assembly factor BamD [Acidobacteriaceae bacterium]|jgi:outer membrane protein assembly factor BamD